MNRDLQTSDPGPRPRFHRNTHRHAHGQGVTALVALLLSLAAQSALAGPTAAPVACGDLLAKTGRKTAGVTFTGCTAHPERQGKPLVALYTVKGRDAAAVEAYLKRTVGLERLRRSCCQWDAPTAWFTIKGAEYALTMSSEETVVPSRARWREIREFGIEVRLLTEEI